MQHFLQNQKSSFKIFCFLIFCLGSLVSLAQTVNVTITQNAGQTDPTNASPIVFQAAFSEAVSGFGAEVADVTIGGTAGATTAVVGGGPTIYTVTVSGMTTDGTVTISIPANAATVVAGTPGRQNVASTNTDNSVTLDATAPIITASSVINITDTQFTLRVNADENSTVFYVVTTSVGIPTAAQIIAGTDENDVLAFKAGSAAATATVNLDQVISGLVQSTSYHIYSVAQDALTNNSNVDSETATTLCTPTNVTNLKIADTNTTATLRWSDPTCFEAVDGIIIAAKLASDGPFLTGPLNNDGTAYTPNPDFSAVVAAPDFDADAQIVFRGDAGDGAGAGQVVTGLVAGTVYNFKVFSRKGTTWSSGNAISTATGAPLMVSLDPINGATGVSTSQVFTITFNENVFISSGGAGDATLIRFSYSGTDPLIPRGSSTGTPSGDGTIDIVGKTATLTLNNDLDIGEPYSILIGANVFRDSIGQNFVPVTWDITTTTGASVTAPTVATCVNQFSPLGDIVITENSDNNFQGTDAGTFVLILGFDKPGYAFSPCNPCATVTATPLGGGDIASITVNSVSFTQATFTVLFANVSNNGQAKDDHDAITISGLKVSRDGSDGAPPAKIVQVTSVVPLPLPIQGATIGSKTFATINAGTTSAAPTVTWPNSNDNSYCIGAGLGITVTASGGSGYRWYDNSDLTGNISALNGNATPTATALGFSSAVAGTFTKYVTNSSSGCESSATPVILIITPAYLADAGSPQSVCSGASFTLGGSPTLQTTSIPGSYSYAWTSPDIGAFAAVGSNPLVVAPTNTNSFDTDTTYTVSITDPNGCPATDNVVVTIKGKGVGASITSPAAFTYSVTDNPVPLVGAPAGGIFTGTGVVQTTTGSGTTYTFNPQSAGIPGSPHQITYTVTINGCPQIKQQFFTVQAFSSKFPNITSSQFCSTEPAKNLNILTAVIDQVEAYVANYNAQNPLYSQMIFRGFVRNYYNNDGLFGEDVDGNPLNNEIIPNGTYTYNAKVYELYQFVPQAFFNGTTNLPNYPLNPTFNSGYFMINIEFVDATVPSNIPFYPYTIPLNYDDGQYFNKVFPGIGRKAGFYYQFQFFTVNEVPDLTISGLQSGLVNPNDFCEINTDYNINGFSSIKDFNGVASPAGHFSVNTGSGFTQGIGTGLLDNNNSAIFNPQDAHGVSAANPHAVTVRYFQDPGTNGSTNQDCSNFTDMVVNIRESAPQAFVSPPTPPAQPAAQGKFCYEDTPVILDTDQNTGGGGIVQWFGAFDNADANGTASFSPKSAFDAVDPVSPTSLIVQVSARYTSPYGCITTTNRSYEVFPKPSSTYTAPLDLKLCYNETAISLDGTNPPVGSTFEFVIDYVGRNANDTIRNTDPISFDPKVRFDKYVTLGGVGTSDASFNVTYIVKDGIGCTASTTKLIEVSPLADVAISGFNDGDKFCSNEASQRIQFTPGGPTVPGGSVTVNSAPPPVALDATNSIYSASLNVGLNTIKYTFLSGTSQCQNFKTINITKVKAPTVGFSTTPVCDGNPATLTANDDPGVSYLYTWILDGDSIRTGTGATYKSIQHVFPGLVGVNQNSYPVKLIVENDPTTAGLLCKDSTQVLQVVGAYPNVDFKYADVCEDDFTRLTIISGTVPIATAEWFFGDGTFLTPNPINSTIPPGTHSNKTRNLFGTPEHQFAFTQGQPNYYSVKLIARTPLSAGNCPDSVRRQVAILEKLTPTPAAPYDMSQINGGDGLWLVESRSDSSTWEFSAPSGKTTITNAAGNVWITNAAPGSGTDDGSYYANDNSFVNSPCFDLSAFSKPVIGMQFWANADVDDGAILQASVNGGTTWQVVGTTTSGTNWYNSPSISSAPGGSNQYGWTGQFQQKWLTGKNSLDAVAGNNNVRFRIAFNSDGKEEADGFAFNNVVIEERNRIMLVEHFSNAFTGNANITESNVNYKTDIELNDLAEVVKLQYHTSFPIADAINADNPADHNARAAFYGVTSQTMPLGFIDGGRDASAPFGFVSPPNPAWWNDFKQKRSLNSSPYTLLVQSVPSASPEELTIHVTGSRIAIASGNHPVLHIAVIEKDVAGNEHVVRKLIPNASGISLDPLATTIDQTYSWIAEGLTDLADLAIIVFIQDEITKEIHQTAIDLNPTNLPTVLVTGTEDAEYGEKINLFPNPANNEINIQLPAAVTKYTPMRMFDTYGRAVVEKNFGPGERSKTINTSELIEGVYIMQIDTPEGNTARRKIMVIHR